MGKKKTKEEFISEAKLIHGDKYDYSLVEYINNKTKVKIKCPLHGIFEQTPSDHLRGKGCLACSGSKKKTTEDFIAEANEIHKGFYDYSKVEYKNNKTKVVIVCPLHGEFLQTPKNHLVLKQGCPICGGTERNSKESFIEKANSIHREAYDYSLVDYKNNKTKVKIVCKKCGNVFEQRPDSHINGKGCPVCKNSQGERIINNYLTKNHIIFEAQKRFDDLKDKNFLSYDFYIPSINLLIEYNGIQHYEPNSHFGGTKTFHLQKHHDWLKRRYAQKNNYKLLTIKYDENVENVLKDFFIDKQ